MLSPSLPLVCGQTRPRELYVMVLKMGLEPRQVSVRTWRRLLVNCPATHPNSCGHYKPRPRFLPWW